ncbi:MAG: LptF/LptG family permease [Deltaproteobacteria bacterium]|nr:LptF/LptG family permease [Deltaproteobacteria bacterium]
MKINSIIYKYIFKEMIPPFVISLLFFNFIFLLTKILDITNMIVNYRISLFDVMLLLIYSMPHFLEFVIPMSTMMTVLLTFFRLSSDNEIVALKAGGMSIYELLPPVLLFCLIGGILTGFMTIYGLPWGRLSFEKLTYEVASSNVNIGIKERTFNDNFKGIMLYTNKIDLKNKTLLDVFIEDQRTKNIISTVVAPKGEMFSEPDKLLFHLRLHDGTINQVNIENKTVHSIKFDTYNINLDLKKSITGKMVQKDEKEMSLTELNISPFGATTVLIMFFVL